MRLDRKRFHPEDVGIVVIDLLADVFLKVIDLVTAEMEETWTASPKWGWPWEPIVKTFFEEVEATIAERQEKVSRSRRRPTSSVPPAARRPGPSWSGKWGRRYGWSFPQPLPDCARLAQRPSAEQAPRRPSPS